MRCFLSRLTYTVVKVLAEFQVFFSENLNPASRQLILSECLEAEFSQHIGHHRSDSFLRCSGILVGWRLADSNR